MKDQVKVLHYGTISDSLLPISNTFRDVSWSLQFYSTLSSIMKRVTRVAHQFKKRILKLNPYTVQITHPFNDVTHLNDLELQQISIYDST